MAIVTKTFTTTCPGALQEAINANGLITPNLDQIINFGGPDTEFHFASALSGPEETELDAVLAVWVCPVFPPETGDESLDDTGGPDTDTIWSSEKITNEFVAQTTTVNGVLSITGGGDLSANRTFELVNDEATPGINKLYGTDATGTKGWFDQPTGGGGSGNPDAPLTSVQFNEGGNFGGSGDFTYDLANSRATIQGPGQDTRLIIKSGTDTLDASQIGQSAYYIQVDGDAQFDALRVKFQRSSAGISGFAAYNYDGVAPNIRLTDEDDDAPYISFQTIASGTYEAPEYVSVFGARGAVGVRDPGQDVGGFAWGIVSNDTPSAAYATYNPAMELDQQWLRIPVGTTAERPVNVVNGMIRYNTTTGKLEGYESGAWEDLVQTSLSITPKEYFYAHNGATTQTLTGTAVTSQVTTVVRSDSIYSAAGGEVTVNKTANFKISFDFTADTTGSRSTGEAFLEINGTLVTGSIAYTYNRNAGQGQNTASGTVLVSITSGDVVRLRIREQSGTIVTVANATRLIIEEID